MIRIPLNNNQYIPRCNENAFILKRIPVTYSLIYIFSRCMTRKRIVGLHLFDETNLLFETKKKCVYILVFTTPITFPKSLRILTSQLCIFRWILAYASLDLQPFIYDDGVRILIFVILIESFLKKKETSVLTLYKVKSARTRKVHSFLKEQNKELNVCSSR